MHDCKDSCIFAITISQQKNKMRLSPEAIQAMKNNNRVFMIIALELETTEATVRRWMRENNENSDLTKPVCVKIISEETDVKRKEILVD